MNHTLHVTKASGEQADFQPEKLRQSLRRAGAHAEKADIIVSTIAGRLREGMSTKEIYRMAHRMLREKSRHMAARYSLKHALLELGPSGYPFEQFVRKLLEADGFDTETDLHLEGRCVSHEVDVLGINRERVAVVECKFHNAQNLDCDVKVPLYIHSRFRDLLDGALLDKRFEGKKIEGWIFTNTRFTDDALRYGGCAGLHLIGWNIPFNYALREWVDRTGLHPLTCLTSLTRTEKRLLLDEQVVLARDLSRFPQLLEKVRMAPARQQVALEEVEQLCRP